MQVSWSTAKGTRHTRNEDRCRHGMIVSRCAQAELIPRNEDEEEKQDSQSLCSQEEEEEEESVHFVGVFDGHGGSACSQYLSESIFDSCQAHVSGDSESEEVLMKAFQDAQEELYSLQHEHKVPQRCGSCAIACLIRNESLVTVAWVGDCRAVLSFAKCDEFVVLSEDHRASNSREFYRVVSQGGKFVRNRLAGLQPTRSMGDYNAAQYLPPGVLSAEPEVVSIHVDAKQKEDRAFMIVASDGLWDVVSTQQACAIVRESLLKNQFDVDAATQMLVDVAWILGDDDVTVAVVAW